MNQPKAHRPPPVTRLFSRRACPARPTAHRSTTPAVAIATALLLAGAPSPALAAPKDLGHGFQDLGVAVPISNHRGTVATTDADGHDVALMWLMDHRGGYELLLVDASSGKSQEFPIPFTAATGDSPYASLLSSANKFYTHFDSNFVEFDPARRQYTFHHHTTPQMAMSMTEDDHGVIWSATYPDSGLVSYNPQTHAFRDYGALYKQNWPQYPRHLAADDAGWIYFALGNTASQIVVVDPTSGKATPVLKEADRKKGIAYVYRDLDGNVYGQAIEKDGEPWYQFHAGQWHAVGPDHVSHPKPCITGSQALFHATFPDGKTIKSCDLVHRRMTVSDPKTHQTKEISFDYKSEGAIVMGLAAAADGTISGGSTFPMRRFSLDPKTNAITNQAAFGQWNAIAPCKNHFYVGGYPGGFLLDWQPNQPWVETVKAKPGCNPQFLTAAPPDVYRPTEVLPLSDDQTIVLAGGPDYGYTGGGLCFYNNQTKHSIILGDKQLIPNQSTRSIVQLPDGKLFGATTTEPGTGGEKKAHQAVLYTLDPATKKIDWQSPTLPGVQDYTDLYATPTGQIYGIADRHTFFVFDPAKHQLVATQPLDFAPTVAQQGPRVFVPGDNGEVFLICQHALARIDPATTQATLLANSPLPLDAGGAYQNGTLYFVAGSHLASYKVR